MPLLTLLILVLSTGFETFLEKRVAHANGKQNRPFRKGPRHHLSGLGTFRHGGTRDPPPERHFVSPFVTFWRILFRKLYKVKFLVDRLDGADQQHVLFKLTYVFCSLSNLRKLYHAGQG